jgi:type IV pilus assembly protein PilW
VPAELSLRNQSCTAINPVRRYLARTYFVATCSDCGRDEIPTLKRLELRDGALVATPVAEGIEEVQFDYGFDLDGDGRPDDFRTDLDGIAGSPANDWTNVMAVRLYVLSRTTEPTIGWSDPKVYDLGAHGTRGPFADAFKRRAYTAVVRLNNPAGWRE